MTRVIFLIPDKRQYAKINNFLSLFRITNLYFFTFACFPASSLVTHCGNISSSLCVNSWQYKFQEHSLLFMCFSAASFLYSMDVILRELTSAFSLLNILGRPPAISLAFSHINLGINSVSALHLFHQHCSLLYILMLLSTVVFWLLKYFSLFAFSVENSDILSEVKLYNRNPLCTVPFSFPSPSFCFIFVFHGEVSHFSFSAL